ncbi:DEAD/DEAH box helicase [Nocardia sp. NPDC049220]|uniref:DEAD/DEAH box helicase n=1 Tax=Nocardia sp. NPDC049220 TaxID=3155273 RepID=UPI0033D79BF9
MTPRFTLGSLVSARGRHWVVLPESEPDMLVLRPLGGSDDEIAAVFPAFEDVSSTEFQPPSPGDLGDAHSAGLLRSALRIGFRSGAGPFRSLAGVAVQPRAYQLVPLLMALRQQTVRLLIADDVGIGKTIEAGLIAAELLAQGDAKRLAVLCSPALAEQWQEELRTKFGIDAECVLSSTVPKLERGLELGESLFQKHQHVVVSTDFIKSSRHRDEFVQHCPDLVIVDEAHTCVSADDDPSSRAHQLRYELLQRIANTDRHLVLVTATPHSGKESAFRNLLGLLKPEFVTLDITREQGRKLLAQHFVQRRRADVRKYLEKTELCEETEFPDDRATKDEPYRLSPDYRSLLEDAIVYAREQVTTAGEHGKREARIAWWSSIALLRSLVSSPRAAAQTLRTRSAAAAAASAEEADELGAPLIRDSADSDVLDGVDVAPGAEVDAVSDGLALLAERAMALEGPTTDLKLKALIKHVKGLISDGYHPIVFCRYIPTAEYVAEHLTDKLGRKAVVRAVTGTLSPQQRIERIEELAEQAAVGHVLHRVLVATDCLSEGVNLQHYFDAVVHYDLAWNPTRHDQREGRVDRYGQKQRKVRVITLIGTDNGIDGKVLEVLIKKHRQIRDALGISVSVPDERSAGVTDAIWEWLLMRGGQREQEGLFAIDELVKVNEKAAELEADWNSTAEREKLSRSRFAQHAIHVDEVAREVQALRDVLGDPREVETFVRQALPDLHGVLRNNSDGGFAADVSGSPAGLRDALDVAVGSGVVAKGKPIPFRTTPAVGRGEAALVRTDPAVGALANFVLNSALDSLPERTRPARRCGVIRTDAVDTRTTLLLVRYRFHLSLRSRQKAETRELVAEDVRLFAFQGAPADAVWLPPQATTELLTAEAAVNTDPEFGERTMIRILDRLPELVGPHLNARGEALATELRESHRRVRSASGEIIGGVEVRPQQPADILGVYVYLPAPTGGTH